MRSIRCRSGVTVVRTPGYPSIRQPMKSTLPPWAGSEGALDGMRQHEVEEAGRAGPESGCGVRLHVPEQPVLIGWIQRGEACSPRRPRVPVERRKSAAVRLARCRKRPGQRPIDVRGRAGLQRPRTSFVGGNQARDHGPQRRPLVGGEGLERRLRLAGSARGPHSRERCGRAGHDHPLEHLTPRQISHRASTPIRGRRSLIPARVPPEQVARAVSSGSVASRITEEVPCASAS